MRRKREDKREDRRGKMWRKRGEEMNKSEDMRDGRREERE